MLLVKTIPYHILTGNRTNSAERGFFRAEGGRLLNREPVVDEALVVACIARVGRTASSFDG